MKWLLFLLLLCSCGVRKHNTLTPEDTSVSCSLTSDQIEQLIDQDIENKHWQRMYLTEIDTAVRHEDWTSVHFYINEFLKIPTNTVPLWLRHHDRYLPEVSLLESHFRIKIFTPAE